MPPKKARPNEESAMNSNELGIIPQQQYGLFHQEEQRVFDVNQCKSINVNIF